MQQISKEYLVLFNAITEAEKVLLNLHTRLILAQQMAEEFYIGSDSSTGLSDGESDFGK